MNDVGGNLRILNRLPSEGALARMNSARYTQPLVELTLHLPYHLTP